MKLATMNTAMFLMIGPSGTGKTLLLKRLYHCCSKGSYSNIDEPQATIPTVGTNLVSLQFSKRCEVTVRELGGTMAPIWYKYYTDLTAVMYMIDLSNPMQLSAACIQLLDVVKDKTLQDTPLLIILNKTDLSSCLPRSEFDYLCCLDEIKFHANQNISVMETSAKTGHSLEQVAVWMQQHTKQ